MQNEIITKRLAELPPLYLDYLQSGEVAMICQSFGEAHSFTDEDVLILENGFALLLLSLISEEQFSKFISTELALPIDKATVLAHTMISVLPAEIQSFINQTEYSAPEEINVVKEIAEAEANLESLGRLRTMATDSAQVGYESTEEPVYTSVQSALINESK